VIGNKPKKKEVEPQRALRRESHSGRRWEISGISREKGMVSLENDAKGQRKASA